MANPTSVSPGMSASGITPAPKALLALELTRCLIEDYVNRSSPSPSLGLPELTEREIDVLRHVALGLANREISDALFISEATVKSHLNRIFSKLQVRDRARALSRPPAVPNVVGGRDAGFSLMAISGPDIEAVPGATTS